MSTNPKTHTLAPEQQAKLNHLVEREMDEAYYTGLYMKAKDARACLREFAVEVLEELGVSVAARDEAAEDCFCDKCGWTGKALYPDYRHEGCGYGALPLWRMELYAAKKEAAELREENKRLRASVDELLLAPNPLDDENMRLRAEAEELRAALRTLVTDLEALMDYYSLRHDYTGEGYLEEVGWHDVLQGGRDNYLTNWNEAKRLAGGESEK